MDRDVAQQLLAKLTAVNTAVQTIVTNTSPSNANRSVSDMRSAPDLEEPEAPEEAPEEEPEEPETRTNK